MYVCKAPQTQPGDSSLAEESMTSKTFYLTSDLFNMTFPKGHCRFIKQHNEHYNHHHSLMFSSLPRKIEYIGQIKTTLSCQPPAETSYLNIFHHFLITADSWHCLSILHSCPAASLFIFYLRLQFPALVLVTYCTTHIRVSHWCLIGNQWCDLAAHGYNALLWLESSCWWNTNLCDSALLTESNKAVMVLLTSALINSLKVQYDRLWWQCCINKGLVLFIIWGIKASLYNISHLIYSLYSWILSVNDSALTLILGDWIAVFL